jgi:hypothetical protein
VKRKGAWPTAWFAAALIGVAGPAFAQSDESADDPYAPAAQVAAPAAAEPAPVDDILSDETLDAAAAARTGTNLGTTSNPAGDADTPETTAAPLVGLKPSLTDALPRAVVRPALPAQTAKLPVTGPIPVPVDREGEAKGLYEPLGLKLGSFDVTASTTTTVGAKRSSVSGGGEAYADIIGEAELRSDWERNSLDFKLRGGLKRSFAGADENAPEADVSLAGAFDITAVDRLSASAGWSLRKDDDYSDSSYGTFSGTLGYERAAGLIGLKTSLAADRTTYSSGDDRDNLALSGALRLSLDSGAVLQPFVEVAPFGRLFDRAATSDGLKRDGIGGELLVGTAFDTGELRGELAAGYAYEAISAHGLDDIGAIVVEGKTTWTPTELLSVEGTLATTFDPSNVAGSAGTVSRGADVTVTYALAPNAYVLAGGSVTLKDWAGLSRDEWTTTLRTGAGYRFNRNVEVGVGLLQKFVDASLAGGDYDETTAEARLTLRR